MGLGMPVHIHGLMHPLTLLARAVPRRAAAFVGLFAETHGTTRYEASGMTSAMGWLWVVFDNLHALGRVDEHFRCAPRAVAG